MKVTPESEAPIIPKATRYQGDCRFAVKNVSVSAPFDVNHEMVISRAKYKLRINSTKPGVIQLGLSDGQSIRSSRFHLSARCKLVNFFGNGEIVDS